jgi:hypothetical protein
MMTTPTDTGIILQTARFTVTLTDVRSRNDMYTLDAVSHCRLRRPVFAMTLVVVVCLSALVSVWWDDLLDHERIIVALLWLLPALASRIARLQLMSIQLRDQTYIHGPYGELKDLKAGIEKALMARSRGLLPSPRHPT